MATPRLEPFQPTPPRRGLHPALRDPVRATQLLGGAMLLLGAMLSWIEVFLPGKGWFEVSSFERANDGGFCLEIGLVVLAVAWSERIMESRHPLLVAGPALLGVVALIVMLLGWNDAQSYLASLANAGGHGYLLPGFWIAGAGSVLVTASGVAGIYRLRREVRYGSPMGTTALATTLGGLAGALVGFAAAVMLGERLDPGSTLGGSTVVFLALGFGIVGIWLGARFGRAFGGGTTDE